MFPGDWAATGRLDEGDARVLLVRHSLVRPGLGWGSCFVCLDRLFVPPLSAGVPAREKICLKREHRKGYLQMLTWGLQMRCIRSTRAGSNARGEVQERSMLGL